MQKTLKNRRQILRFKAKKFCNTQRRTLQERLNRLFHIQFEVVQR